MLTLFWDLHDENKGKVRQQWFIGFWLFGIGVLINKINYICVGLNNELKLFCHLFFLWLN
jgi:hypothetical protein